MPIGRDTLMTQEIPMTMTPEARQMSHDLTAELLDLIAEATAANERLH